MICWILSAISKVWNLINTLASNDVKKEIKNCKNSLVQKYFIPYLTGICEKTNNKVARYSFHLILNPVQLLCLVSSDFVSLYSPMCHVCQLLLSAELCFNVEQKFRVKNEQGETHIPYISHWVIINVPSHYIYSSDRDDVEGPWSSATGSESLLWVA